MALLLCNNKSFLIITIHNPCFLQTFFFGTYTPASFKARTTTVPGRNFLSSLGRFRRNSRSTPINPLVPQLPLSQLFLSVCSFPTAVFPPPLPVIPIRSPGIHSAASFDIVSHPSPAYSHLPNLPIPGTSFLVEMAADMSGEQMQAKITAARREAEGLKDKIKRRKDELADTTRTNPLSHYLLQSFNSWNCSGLFTAIALQMSMFHFGY